MKQIRVVLADDHPVVLAGIGALLKADPDIMLVGDAGDGSEALSLIRSTLPDVAVVDISMPGLSGLELTRRVRGECPDVKLLVLTVHEDPAYVQPLLQAGARGYLLKRSAAEDLPRAIRAVAEGGIYLDPAIAGQALSDPHHAGTTASDDSDQPCLSPRERGVLRFIAQGFSNKEIAARMEVSVKTVETYKARAAEKLGLRTRSEIIRYGVEHGWLDELTIR